MRCWLRIVAPAGVASDEPNPRDDRGGIKDDGGTTHRSPDVEIYSFAFLLAAAVGYDWSEGHQAYRSCCKRPEFARHGRTGMLRRDDRGVAAVDATDPMFARFSTEDLSWRESGCRRIGGCT